MGIKEFQGGSGQIPDPRLLSLDSGSALLQLLAMSTTTTKVSGDGIGSSGAAIADWSPEGGGPQHHHHHYPFVGIDPSKTGRLIREKLKGKKDENESKRGPLVARHAITTPQTDAGDPSSSKDMVHNVAAKDCPTTPEVHVAVARGTRRPLLRTSRTPSPSALRRESLLSSSERVGLQRSQSNVVLNNPRRRRSPSTPRSRPGSPSSIRGSSPAGSVDNLYIETVLKRVHVAMRARLYLLQQLGPHSFVVGGDSPEHKFKIMIGPQTCTCARGPHCVHILFVMLRVFQISENDPRLWCKQLKNFEVESLFLRYEQQRSSRVRLSGSLNTKSSVAYDGETGDFSVQCEGAEDNGQANIAISLAHPNDNAGEKCVICLLEMVDCESLVDCSTGCHNKYHLHCISIWAEHCRRQEMQLFCPLCRILWNGLSETDPPVWQIESESFGCHVNVISQSSEANSEPPIIESPITSSPSLEPFQLSSIGSVPSLILQSGFKTFQQQSGQSAAAPFFQKFIGHSLRHPSHTALPRCHSVVPKEFVRTAAVWAEVFGHDLVACLFSRDWKMKVVALRRLSEEVSEELGGTTVGGNVSDEHVEVIVRLCCQIVTNMVSNPVYKVCLACLQCLKTVMAYVSVKTEENLLTLQNLLMPVVLAILLRCCDGTKPGELSVATLIELCKGQTGELAIGKQTPYPSECGIGGVSYVLRCLFDGIGENEPRSWQWLLGRLNVLEKLMLEFPQEFHLVLVRSNEEGSSRESRPLLPIASRYTRLVTVWKFALAAMCVQHTNVVKQAREVFMMGARFASTVPAIMQQMLVLATTNPLLEQRVLAWVRDERQGYLQNLWSAAELPDISQSRLRHNSSNIRGSAKQPHLPSCGGISPTKGLDHNYFVGKLGSGCGNPVSPVPSPCPSATSSPSAVRRRFPAWNASCNASSRVNSPQQLQPTPPGRSDCSIKTGARGKRPTFLPLQGTFRDVLEWEKCNGTTSPTRSVAAKHRSPSRPRFEADVNAGLLRSSGQQSNSFRRSLSIGGDKSPRSPRAVDVVVPTIKSHRRSSDVAAARPNSRLCSRKLDAILGPILPSLPNHVKGLPKIKTPTRRSDYVPSALFNLKPQPPTVPPCSPEDVTFLLDNKLCKLKQRLVLEEAVALVSAIENSVHQTEIPEIPGLTPCDDEQEFIIRNEPDDADEESSSSESYAYVENVQWHKGPILGTGAFSTCYQVRDVNTGTLMAMKQVSFCRNSPDEQDKVMGSIKEEIGLMARLNHPHIVRIMGATRQQNHFNVFVEWMPGGSVSNLLDKYGAFAEPVIINYTQQVLSGLVYLHDHQVLHRDLKGANLLVDSTGHHLRIGDFGAAARLASRTTIAGEFQGQLLGTIAFMAPEVLRGDDYGRSCDIWSVGCALIEMATTKPPWNAKDVSNHLALIYKIARAKDPPPIPERLSPATRDLALRCLEVKCDDRPPAKELLRHPVFQPNWVSF